MSFLTPLYILGVLAVAAPVLFHLIRHATRNEAPFSSLMFLAASPPRITRKTRVENWPLLLLRAAALTILAAAFARPFLRQSAALNLGNDEQRRTVLMIDVSASMRRGDLWAQARKKALEVVSSSGAEDQLAIYAFDDATQPVLGFRESAALVPSQKLAAARARIDRLSPTWRSTHLGQALIDAAGAIEDVGDETRSSSKARREIVLITDLQKGSRLDVLGDFEWPEDLTLDVRALAAPGSNAALEWLPPSEEGADPKTNDDRVRVSNDAASDRESFTLAWSDAPNVPPIPAYVPPGESRVVRIPRPPGSSTGRSLRLRGDVHDFDNMLFLATDPEETATVLFVGSDRADDPEGLLYYLDRVYDDSPRHKVSVEEHSPADPLVIDPVRPPSLIVVASETSTTNVANLGRYARGGGTVLALVGEGGDSATLAGLADVTGLHVEDGDVRGDVMLGEIDFHHPLFAPLAASQFNDFTKIRFWKYRKVAGDALGEAQVVARFEGGDPAMIEKRLGKGRLVVMTSSWRPADGQLARSSKFVPLMAALLTGMGTNPEDAERRFVRDALPLPDGAISVRKPDGSTAQIEPGTAAYLETDLPGIYTIGVATGPRQAAVNLDPTESRTAPLGVETLEQFGCRLVRPAPEAAGAESIRQMQNAELEGRQKLWRLLVLATIAVLFVETWLGGRLGRSRPIPAGVSTP